MISVLFLISAFAAGIIGTIVGFGSSTIFLPLALFFVDFKTALILVAFFHFFGNLSRISFFRQGLDKKLMFFFGVPSVLLTIFGALIVNYTPLEILKLCLGIFLLFFSILYLAKPNLKLNFSKKNAVIGGSVSGFFAGLLGTGGAIRGAFMATFNLSKKTYLATAAAIALAVDIIPQKAFRNIVLVAIALISLKFLYEGVLYLL